MAAPAGNRNAAKAKEWESAIRKALIQRSPETLREIADKLVAKALEGDQFAIKEIGDRLDGKPKQTIAGDPDAPLIPPALQVVFPAANG